MSRRRIYGGLLIFAVAAGLPMMSVRPLRNRLFERVMALKAAAAGDVEPLSLKVGENHEPFPAEYERRPPPLPSLPQFPPIDKIYNMTPAAQVQPKAAPRLRSASKIEKTQTSPLTAIKIVEKTNQVAADTAPPADNELNYQTGTIEQEAYELLLKSNSTIAGMIKGSNPALIFKSWDVANRGNDTYWVRIKFQSEGNQDVEYIWQVKVEANQVMPLSYNARTIS
jgi:hypothetical protein